jgi:probable metal-binding protein
MRRSFRGTTMPTSLHGHDVIRLIGAAPAPLTRPQIEEAITRQAGGGVSFHVCAGDGMSLDELLAFLMQRGKITQHADGTFTADVALMCDHDDHAH